MLKYIQVKHYRRLKDFHLNGLNRINIITGPNDIGKTSVLESCSFAVLNSPNSFLLNLFNILGRRDPEIPLRNLQNGNIEMPQVSIIKKIRERYNSFSIRSNISEINFINAKDEIDKLFEVDLNGNKKIYRNLIDPNLLDEIDLDNTVFIVDCGGSVIKLKEWYGRVQTNEDEDFINTNIKKFDPNIEKFKIIHNEPAVKIKGKKEYIPITELGEGLKRFIFFMLAFYKVKKKGYVFIDELENGIWYKNYDLMWENIIYLSNKFDVQVFITTHSKEIIESCVRVCDKVDFDELCLVELFEKNKKVDYMLFNKMTLKLELDNSFEVRG
ncbi:AAA family ATPase [Nautilia sp.]